MGAAKIDREIDELEKKAAKASKKAGGSKKRDYDSEAREAKASWRRRAGVAGIPRMPSSVRINVRDLDKGLAEFVKGAEKRDDAIGDAAAKHVPKAQDILDFLKSVADKEKIRRPKYQLGIFSKEEFKELKKKYKDNNVDEDKD